MLRLAMRRAGRAILNPKPVISSSSPAPVRLFTTDYDCRTQPEKVAGEMIRYAVIDARTRSSGGGDWREESMRILEQGVSNLDNGEKGSGEAVGLLLLNMATLLYESGKYKDAIEKLEEIYERNSSNYSKDAAWEGLMGVKMETGLDVKIKDLCSCRSYSETSSRGLDAFLNGDFKAAKVFFEQLKGLYNYSDYSGEENALLTKGENLHINGDDLQWAQEIYDTCIYNCEHNDYPREYNLTCVNMAPEETYIAGLCSLGQLFSHTGKMNEAEEMLTKALTNAEAHFGKSHPKVGVVLTCIAKMYKEKDKLEGSTSIIVQEGLYRKALDILKAPDLSSEAKDVAMERRDIISLARGGYAELLLIQQNRKEEGERMKKWAESIWRNKRLSLAEALDFSESSKLCVVDTRVCRVI